MNPDIQPISSPEELESALTEPRAILFKHSTRCWVSNRSLAEVERYLAESPDTPVYLIDVIANRALSREVAERLNVWHQSPQAILIEDGRATWNVSHSKITARAIRKALSAGAGRTAETARDGAGEVAQQESET